MCAVDAIWAASRWLAVTYLSLVATTPLWLYGSVTHTTNIQTYNQSHNKNTPHKMQSVTHYLHVDWSRPHPCGSIQSRTQHNQSHNIITHTTQSVTQSNQSHNTIDIIHRIQTVTHYLRVCGAVSNTPVAQYNYN